MARSRSGPRAVRGGRDVYASARKSSKTKSSAASRGRHVLEEGALALRDGISQSLPGGGGSGRGGSTSGERLVARNSSRVFVVVLLFALVAIVFFAKLIYLQVIIAPTYAAQAEAARTVGFALEPRRGTIYDRNGNILAISVDATTVYANPSEIETPGRTARVIAECLGGTPTDYIDSLAAGENVYFSFVKRKANVDAAQKLKEALAEEELPGIYFISDTRREYPYGSVGGQVVGGVNIAVDEEENLEYYEGASGLELYYNTTLAGTYGYYEAEIGADGTPIPGGVHVSRAAIEGQDIVVSIDIDFQKELENALVAGCKRVEADTGSAIVMDAKTGEIYAAASLPFFNPADRSKVEAGSMRLACISNLLEPGSVFKTVSATAVLENKVMTPEDEIFCPAYLEADGYIVADAGGAQGRGDEMWSLRTIINRSSNVGISMCVEKMGFDKLYDAILRYNLNSLSGVDYPGEQLGYLLDFDYWSRVQGYNVSFGQGISVTPLQMLRFYGSLLNDGYEVTPHFLLRKPQSSELPVYGSVKVIDNTDAIDPMVSMLKTVVTDGTGTLAAIDGYDVAGKTSTAEIFDEENGGYRPGVYNIAFTGFIADSTSNLVCFVGADEVPGDRTVTPAFKDIMTAAINRYNILPE